MSGRMPRVKKTQKKTPAIQEERIFKSKEVKEAIPNLNIEVVKGEVPVIETEVPVIRTIKEKKKRFVSEARKEQLKKARARSVEVRRQRKEDAKKYNNKQPERARSVGEARLGEARLGEASVGEEYVNLDEEFLEEDTTPAPNQPYNSSPLRMGELDYNRITDMVYNKFQSRIKEKQEQERVRQEEDNEIRQFEEGIRADERKKMAEKFRNYGGGRAMRRPTNATPHKSKYNLGIGGNRSGGSGGVFGNFW